MNLHEYQAKSLLAKYGVPVLRGFLAYTPREVQKAAVNLGGKTVVVKAEIHAGGRGKGGGVKLAHNPDDALLVGQQILGMTLVSPQTGTEGKLVRKVWVEEGARIKREFYLSILLDRAIRQTAFVASAEGGMDIEEVAAHSPEKIVSVSVKHESGLQAFHCRRLGAFLGIDKSKLAAFSEVIEALYRAYLNLDCAMLEINPLIETEDGKFFCLDAKLAIDDDALYRQREAYEFMDFDEIDERELFAKSVGINYVPLDGNIGCLVNGAGLAMATMDIIKQAGGEPANFLDVGGGATKEMVTKGFQLILQDEKVKGVLVNIFGGIMRCDVIAEGVIAAAQILDIKVPLVVRLQGTNVEEGKRLLKESNLKIIAADNMDEAAERIVAAVR